MTLSANSSKAILLLGHGSKAQEANETLRKIAVSVKAAGGYGYVLPAYLQLERPDFQEAVDTMVSRGFMDIVVMPYFLYMGLHVTKDLPSEIDEAKKRYPGLKVTLTENLGFHDKLVDITVERIEEAFGKNPAKDAPLSQHPIERESFRIIEEEVDLSRFSALEAPIVKRVIHSTADFEYLELIRFSANAIASGLSAIKDGCNIITDVKMAEAGITRARLARSGNKVLCFSSDNDVERLAASSGTTKTAASMRKAIPYLEGSIVAIGNAPTALQELLKIIKNNGPRPSLIIGVPVGFVGAEEAKEELMRSGLEYIAIEGRKGGSTVAVAIVNALAIEAAAVQAEG